MNEPSSKSLLEQSLALTIRDLERLRTELAAIQAEYRAKVEPLERRIATLDSVAIHQERALRAFEGDEVCPQVGGVPRQVTVPAGSARLTDVLEAILAEAGRPMHYTVLAQEAMRMGVAITAKDPGAFVINYLRREPERFCRTAMAGEYALLCWGLPGSKRMDENRSAVKNGKAKPRRMAPGAKGRKSR